MDIAEIKHMLLHALTEDSIAAKIDAAKSQQEVYSVLQELSYFTLSMEEFSAGIAALRDETVADEHECDCGHHHHHAE